MKGFMRAVASLVLIATLSPAAQAKDVIVFAIAHWYDRGGLQHGVAEAARAATERQATKIAIAWCEKSSGGKGNCHPIITTTEGANFISVGYNWLTNDVAWAFSSNPVNAYTTCQDGGYSCGVPVGGKID